MGLQIYVSWLPAPNDVTPFEENAKQLFSTDGLNWRTQSSYDATSAIAHGIQRLLESGDEITGASLQGRLSNPRFAADGVVGENSVKFDRNGDRDLRDLDGQIGMIVQVEEAPNSTPEKPRYMFVRSVD